MKAIIASISIFISADAQTLSVSAGEWGIETAEQNRFCDADYFALLLIDARPVDTVNIKACLKSLILAKNAQNLFGHVWILMVDQRNCEFLECGYTGEGSATLPGYLEGVGLLLQGHANAEMKECGADVENPISYLFKNRNDGHVEWGSGGHLPNCAVGIAIDQNLFNKMLSQIANCKKTTYNLQNDNCIHFALSLMRIAKCNLTCPNERLYIPKTFSIDNHRAVLRRKFAYRYLRLSTPKALSLRLKKRFDKKHLELSLNWYKKNFKGLQCQAKHYRQQPPWREVHCRQG